jgi:hypothetical protein
VAVREEERSQRKKKGKKIGKGERLVPLHYFA